MADSDQFEVAFTGLKVYHDGTSMQVKNAGDTGEISRVQVRTFLAEKVIEKPEGWEDDEDAVAAMSVADGAGVLGNSGQAGSGGPAGSKFAVGDDELDVPDGYSVTEKGGGWYLIDGPEGVEQQKAHGLADLREKLAALPTPEAPPPA